MNALAAMVLVAILIALAVAGTLVLGRRPPRPARRGRSRARIQQIKRTAAEDVAAIRGETAIRGEAAVGGEAADGGEAAVRGGVVTAYPDGPRGYPGGW